MTLCAVLALMGGCDSRSGDGQAPDSEPGWIANLAAARVIEGGGDGGQGIAAISDAIFLRGGSIAVADRIDRVIKVFSQDGRYVATFGREGTGPGEFRTLRTLVRIDDERVAAWDPELRRITTLHVADGAVETATLRFDGFDRLVPSFVGAMGDRGWIFRDRVGTRGEAEGIHRERAAFLLVGPSGESRAGLIELEGDELFARPMEPREGITGTLVDRVLLGSRVLAGAHQGGLVLARTDSTDLVLVDHSGRITQEHGASDGGEPLASEVAEGMRRVILDSIAGRRVRFQLTSGAGGELTDRDRAIEIARATPAAEVAPVYTRLIVSADGTAWLRRFDRVGASHQDWWQHGADLEVARGVRMPATVEVLDILGDDVLALQTDGSGEEVLLVIPIQRRSGSA